MAPVSLGGSAATRTPPHLTKRRAQIGLRETLGIEQLRGQTECADKANAVTLQNGLR